MTLNRRTLLTAAGASAAIAIPGAKGQPASAPPTAPGVEARLLASAQENVLPIEYDGRGFAGAGWDLLLNESRAAEFVLLGEEHGMAETPILARHLFQHLANAGFDNLAIEISPPIAEDLDRAARGGLAGIKRFVAQFPPGPAFYFWRTEAELIAAARAAVPGRRDVLWGLDYEVTGDRRLIERLKAAAPPRARLALAAMEQASAQAWDAWRTTHNPGRLFTFSGDPGLVRAVRSAWRDPDAEAARVLDTLEETLEINALFPSRAWESNERRARFNRANLIAHLNRADREGRRPKAMFKMGESHLQRGVNWSGNFDIGSLAAEVAVLRGGASFSVLVGGGAAARHGVLNPSTMTVADRPVDMFAQLGLSFIVETMAHDGPALIDLRPMRRLLVGGEKLRAFNNPEAVRNIHGYDALIVWNGAAAAQMLSAP